MNEPGVPHSLAPRPLPDPNAKLIAVTVRLDRNRYERLKLFGLRRRLSNQQILVRALDQLITQP